MRIVRDLGELDAAYHRCASEAQTAFGDPSVYVEAYIEHARHVEVQVLGDAAGHLMALGDRDCSVQLRHQVRTGARHRHYFGSRGAHVGRPSPALLGASQKVVEVAPCMNLPSDLRRQLTADALRLCAKAGLVNAATVEFLVPLQRPRSGRSVQPYYFLEVNPRIQVSTAWQPSVRRRRPIES